ncbi:MAG: hypothetical protein ACKOCW_13870 [Planctomycetaceae bacterium]
MNASTVRFVDRWLGVPACAMLTVWRRLFDRRRATAPVRRILFLKLVEQGATVLAGPSLRAAVERVGYDNVFFMVLEENRPILDMLGIVKPANVISIPKGGVVTTLRGMIAALLRARREKIDSILDFELFARSSAVIAYLTGAARRVGYTPTTATGRGVEICSPIDWSTAHRCTRFGRCSCKPTPSGSTLPDSRRSEST